MSAATLAGAVLTIDADATHPATPWRVSWNGQPLAWFASWASSRAYVRLLNDVPVVAP